MVGRETGLIKECIRTPEQEAPASVMPAASMENTMMVMEVLPIGRENAVGSRELAERLHFESVRDLQMEIARERKAGAVILSTCGHGGGYFLPDDQQEIKQFIRTLENRANNTLAALKSARELLGQQEGNT